VFYVDLGCLNSDNLRWLNSAVQNYLHANGNVMLLWLVMWLSTAACGTTKFVIAMGLDASMTGACLFHAVIMCIRQVRRGNFGSYRVFRAPKLDIVTVTVNERRHLAADKHDCTVVVLVFIYIFVYTANSIRLAACDGPLTSGQPCSGGSGRMQ
jgi:hypothetical protein